MSGPAESAAALVRQLRDRFRVAGLMTPELDARLLVALALGIPPERLPFLGQEPVSTAVRTAAEAYARRRLSGEPVGRIRGVREFWGLPFRLSPATLEPRADTETLISAALALMADGTPERPLRIADIGTGSGAILVALLSEWPHAIGTGIDISAEAIQTARENAVAAGVGGRAFFAVGNYLAPLAPGYDLIASNPPYIPAAEIATLAPEVRDHDPRRALDGGVDGLDAYRAILAAAAGRLTAGGLLLLEIGAGQEHDVGRIAETAGLPVCGHHRDLAGHVRVLECRRPTEYKAQL
ncbi:peptide chain release factor N(5)-glutamine methyltransferase [Segnochrobactraceae bacterium EtOH-i3]